MSRTVTSEVAVTHLKPQDTGKSVIFDIPKEVLEQDPFDPRFFITDKNREELIKYFEKGIRDSFEYKWMIDLFKTVLDVKSCVFFKNYSIDNGMKLEFHHHPFTLYDYVEAVVNKQIAKNAVDNEEEERDYVYENDVMRETTMIHYKLMVGLVPLDPTSHGLVHDHKLDIPAQLIIGDYEKFYSEYYNYISEAAKAKYQEFLNENPVTAELEYPENYKYKPAVIKASNKQLITVEKVDRLMLSNKLDRITNDNIAKILGGN